MITESNFVDAYNAWATLTDALVRLRTRWLKERKTWPANECGAANEALRNFAVALGIPLVDEDFRQRVTTTRLQLEGEATQLRRASLNSDVDDDGFEEHYARKRLLQLTQDALALLGGFERCPPPPQRSLHPLQPNDTDFKVRLCQQISALMVTDAEILRQAEASHKQVVACVLGLLRASDQVETVATVIGNCRQPGVPEWAWDKEIRVPPGYEVEDFGAGPFLLFGGPKKAVGQRQPGPRRLARDLRNANPDMPHKELR